MTNSEFINCSSVENLFLEITSSYINVLLSNSKFLNNTAGKKKLKKFRNLTTYGDKKKLQIRQQKTKIMTKWRYIRNQETSLSNRIGQFLVSQTGMSRMTGKISS